MYARTFFIFDAILGILADVPLASRGLTFRDMEGHKKTLKRYPDLFIESGPIRCLNVNKNHTGLVVSEAAEKKLIYIFFTFLTSL